MVRTYAEAGVSQDEKAAHIAALVSALTYRRRGFGRPLTKIGHFTGLVDFGAYALSLCTDSVGTKVLVAKEMRRWDTIGIDCVATNANDMICVGAEPIAFVDYVAIESYDREVARQIGVGLNRGAEMANVSIIGGEIAVVPELVREYELGGIEDPEMYQTFNMGMGFAVVGSEDAAKNAIRAMRPDVQGKVVGEVARGRGVVHEPLGLRWESY